MDETTQEVVSTVMPEGFSFTELFAAIAEGLEMTLDVCTKFPLNLFIGGSVIFMGIGIYRRLKH